MSRGKYNPDGGRESGLAGRIRQIIRESGVKQVEFAQSLGISANYVYLLTSGRKTAISETLARLIEQELTKKLLDAPDLFFRFNSWSLYSYSVTELVSAGSEMVDRMALRRNE